MSQSVSTLYGLLASNGLPSDVFDVLSKPPWNMSTIQQLANSFETKEDILSGVCVRLTRYSKTGATSRATLFKLG
eukprot:5251977-Karenia_brevis.AAC.1